MFKIFFSESVGTWNPKKEKEIDVEQMEEVFKINFFGTVNSIKAVEQYFRERKDGIITIVSSIAGYRGLPNSTGYGPSKSALNNLAESLYFDFKRFNVRVCLVSPGFIKTPMTTMCAEYKVSSVEVQKISNQFKTEVKPKENQAEVN